jgi:hypothetical protein
MSTNSWNSFYVLISYISFGVLIAYFGGRYVDIDIDTLLFNNNKQYMEIAQILMVILGILSIISWEMSDYAKQTEKKKN